MMRFWRILLGMTMRPMPGRRFTHAWDDKNWQPFTEAMKLLRFYQIQAALHMNKKEHPNAKNDMLHKVRPLLNI